MIRIWCFHCCGLASVPGQETEILQATWHGQKKERSGVMSYPVLGLPRYIHALQNATFVV